MYLLRSYPYFRLIMLVLNGTLALQSALSSTGVFRCNYRDVDTLYSPDFDSPIMYFACLVITGFEHPAYCDLRFYTTLTSSCASCTFSTLTSNLLPCFNRCSIIVDSDYCATCTGQYISEWHDTCAPAVTIDLPTEGEYPAACNAVEFADFGGLDVLATDMINCLSLNQTRNVECMAGLGYVGLNSTCTDCMYSIQDVTDVACESVCVGRAFSSLCRKCVSAYVQASTSRCFKSDTFTITIDPPCEDSDLDVLGSDSQTLTPLVNECVAGQTCEETAFKNQSTVSHQCATCLDSASISDCSSECIPEVSLVDCISTPVINPLAEDSTACLYSDMANFYSKSITMKQVNACLYSSGNPAVNCFSPIYQSEISSTCSSCFSDNIELNLDCSSLCPADEAKSEECQLCLVAAYTETIEDCFSTGSVTVCDVEAIAGMSYDSWGTAYLSRCLLRDMTKASECLVEAGFGSIASECRACLTSTILGASDCQADCALSETSDSCRACMTALPAAAAKACSTNSKLLHTIEATTTAPTASVHAHASDDGTTKSSSSFSFLAAVVILFAFL